MELTLDAIPAEASPAELVGGFVPTPRFAHVSFAGYRPDSREPSQARALARVQTFVEALATDAPARSGLFARFRPRRPRALRGLYLDGGFGVGKTHLLPRLTMCA